MLIEWKMAIQLVATDGALEDEVLSQLTGPITTRNLVKHLAIRLNKLTGILKQNGALESACWFWKAHNINKYCDKQDIIGMTQRINGGTIGLEDPKKALCPMTKC